MKKLIYFSRLCVFISLVFVLGSGSCQNDPQPSRLTIPNGGAVGSAITLDQVVFSKTKNPSNVSGNAVAEMDRGKHKLIATIDGAGPGVKFTSATARHHKSTPNASGYVQFNVTGVGGNTNLNFELTNAEWIIMPVEAYPVGGGAAVANAKVKASLKIRLNPDQRSANLGAIGVDVAFQPVGGAPKLEYQAVQGRISANGTLRATANIKSGATYTINIVAQAEGEDIPGTNGYIAGIILKYGSIKVYSP